MNDLTFTRKLGAFSRKWESDIFQPTKSSVEISVMFKKRGGLVSILRSSDGENFTLKEGATQGNYDSNLRQVVFTVSGLIPGGYLKLQTTSEPSSSGNGWRENV
jgi:hypothetical protein